MLHSSSFRVRARGGHVRCSKCSPERVRDRTKRSSVFLQKTTAWNEPATACFTRLPCDICIFENRDG